MLKIKDKLLKVSYRAKTVYNWYNCYLHLNSAKCYNK